MSSKYKSTYIKVSEKNRFYKKNSGIIFKILLRS